MERPETKCYGMVRGGSNDTSRFFLHIKPEGGMTEDEMQAIFTLWDEEFGLKGRNWLGRCYPVRNRREFACVPAIVRKAERLGYDVSTSMWDVGIKGEAILSENPVEFWKALALAQAYFRE